MYLKKKKLYFVFILFDVILRELIDLGGLVVIFVFIVLKNGYFNNFFKMLFFRIDNFLRIFVFFNGLKFFLKRLCFGMK